MSNVSNLMPFFGHLGFKHVVFITSGSGEMCFNFFTTFWRSVNSTIYQLIMKLHGPWSWKPVSTLSAWIVVLHIFLIKGMLHYKHHKCDTFILFFFIEFSHLQCWQAWYLTLTFLRDECGRWCVVEKCGLQCWVQPDFSWMWLQPWQVLSFSCAFGYLGNKGCRGRKKNQKSKKTKTNEGWYELREAYITGRRKEWRERLVWRWWRRRGTRITRVWEWAKWWAGTSGRSDKNHSRWKTRGWIK